MEMEKERTRSMSEQADPHCLFCGIVSGRVQSDQVYADDAVIAFRDRRPQAPIHVLVIPRAHVRGADAPEAEDGALLAALLRAANIVARREGVAAGGYRLVWNVGPDAGQSVFHLHLHVLGGRPLGWPPG